MKWFDNKNDSSLISALLLLFCFLFFFVKNQWLETGEIYLTTMCISKCHLWHTFLWNFGHRHNNIKIQFIKSTKNQTKPNIKPWEEILYANQWSEWNWKQFKLMACNIIGNKEPCNQSSIQFAINCCNFIFTKQLRL